MSDDVVKHFEKLPDDVKIEILKDLPAEYLCVLTYDKDKNLRRYVVDYILTNPKMRVIEGCNFGGFDLLIIKFFVF